MTAGAVTGARRLARPSSLRWEITVQPASDADLVLALPVTTDCAAQGAVCTSSGKALSERIEATVRGPGSEPSGGGFPLAREDSRPSGIWSDGQTLWAADWRERVYAYRLADGGRAARRDIEAGAADTDPTGLWSAGGTLLATGWEGAQARAYRLPEAVETIPGKKSGSGLVARAASMAAIADPALQATIGEALGKAPGEAVSPRDLAGLEALAARDVGIRDLSGLEQAVNLKELDLGFNPLRDLQPLAGLSELVSLNLDGAVTDLQALAPLSRLSGLRRLDLRGNPVGDLRPLRALESLAWVHVGGSRIEDLSPLDGLPGLTVAARDDREPPSVDGRQDKQARQR